MANRPSPTSAIIAEIEALIRERRFETIEEVNAFVAEHMRERNARPLEQFEGLSPDAMHRLLDFPFESPEVVRFDFSIRDDDRVPFLDLWRLLAEAIGAKGVKATDTGNLPRNLSREVMRAHLGEEGYARYFEYGEPRTEADAIALHGLRVTAEMAGLLRRAGGRFHLTRRALDAARRDPTRARGAAYEALFRAYTRKFAWGYLDRFPELPIVQQSFAFTLRLLQRTSGEGASAASIAERFLRAFPAAVTQVPERAYVKPEDEVRWCFTFRALDRFASRFGLVEPRTERFPDHRDEWVVKVTPLGRRVATFA